ncbi:hypothetical protein SeMB42_g02082, partial [Synchytrium endobioticum]
GVERLDGRIENLRQIQRISTQLIRPNNNGEALHRGMDEFDTTQSKGRRLESAFVSMILYWIQVALIGSFQGFILSEVYWYTRPSWDTGINAGGVILVYCALLIVAQFFSAIFAWDAQIHKNTIQVIANVLVFNLGTFIYSLIQLKQLNDLKNAATAADNVSYIDASFPMLYVQIVFAFLFLMAQGYLSYLVYQEYGWSIWLSQGASLQKRATLRRYHFFILFLKLNLYFLLGIVLQAFVAEYWDAKWKSATTVVLFLIMLLWYILGYYAVHTQSPVNYALMGLYLFLVGANFVAVAILLVLLNTAKDFAITRDFLNFFAVVSSLFSLATLAFGGLLVISDFENDWLFDVLRGLDRTTQFTKVTVSEKGGDTIELKRTKTVLD